MAKASLKKIL